VASRDMVRFGGRVRLEEDRRNGYCRAKERVGPRSGEGKDKKKGKIRNGLRVGVA